jgi:rhamnogalacturonan endolyase
MATYITAEPTVGELRWIARLNSALVPNADQLGATTAGGTAIEASDVVSFIMLT